MAFDWGRGIGNAGSGAYQGAQIGGPWGGAIGGAAGLATGFFGNKDPSEAARMIDNIPGRVKPFLNPYIGAGQGAIPYLQQQYAGLTSDPSGFINRIGAGYKESPGFKFALEKALAGGNRASAAGGMGGSPSSSLWGMETAQGLASQDYNTFLQNALSQYGLGLKGEEGLANMGEKAATGYGDLLSQALSQEAKMKYGGQNYGA